MAKKNSWDDLIEALISIGLFYIIYKLVHDEPIDEQDRKQYPGIHGLPGRKRHFRAFRDGNKEPYRDDLQKLDNKLISQAIDLANTANTSEELRGNWIEWFHSDIITGELKKGQLRILFYRITELDFELLTVFLKKDEETNRLYKEKARERIKKINSRTS